jgi:hypothetical protein
LLDLQDLLSQLPTPYLLLGDFNARHHVWGAVDEDERGRILETLISTRNLVVLNTGEPTHISLASGILSCFDLAICSPALSLHLTWTLLADLCGSDHFPICLSLQSASLQEERNPNWVMKQADWVIISQLAEIEETYCPTVDSMVDMFTHAVLRASEESIPPVIIQTTLCSSPVVDGGMPGRYPTSEAGSWGILTQPHRGIPYQL